ncbi:hypothetical protein BT96DRAFT_118007 [Gymnopus androsaceus JB14]|uniref:F-box domain-containing protein n=1 Tax=Gymnopus androsaceus JB14 TaxID=1447944 RepID=A0A6A4HCZ2_9AGAR|nr:hypothetical protein BT96DRAFT_118007 [Gymnopus androsaceus JB14]
MRNNPELEDLSLDFVGRNLLERGETLFLENLLQGVPVGQPLRLKRLSIRAYVWNVQISPGSIIHLKHLTTLEFPLPGSGKAFVSIAFTMISKGLWDVLGHHEIRLKHLYAPVTGELVDYLVSYSGIEYLRLYGPVDDSLAHRFHERVLRRHATSLKILNTSLVASANGQWAFSEHNAHIFGECVGLRELSVSIDYSYGYYSPMDTLTLLLRTSNSLPHLRWLSLVPALSPHTYGSYSFFLQWTDRMSRFFPKLDVTELLENSEGSLEHSHYRFGVFAVEPLFGN